jgi:hypothetical protein
MLLIELLLRICGAASAAVYGAPESITDNDAIIEDAIVDELRNGSKMGKSLALDSTLRMDDGTRDTRFGASEGVKAAVDANIPMIGLGG